MNNNEWQPQVGTKGKTRDGRDYEVVAVGVAINNDDSVVAVVEGTVVTYRDNGRYFKTTFDGKDLLRPTRIVYVNLYPKANVGCSGSYVEHPTEQTAREVAGRDALAVAVPVEIPL